MLDNPKGCLIFKYSQKVNRTSKFKKNNLIKYQNNPKGYLIFKYKEIDVEKVNCKYVEWDTARTQ